MHSPPINRLLLDMSYSGEIPVVYENGVFRPETPVDIPEHSRLRISIRDGEPGPANGTPPLALIPFKEALNSLRTRGLIRTGGWLPTREELHERG